MRQQQQTKPLFIAMLLLLAPAWSALEAQSGAPAASEAYGYFRTVEGTSLLSSREPEETRDLEINLPILAGDAVQIGRAGRVEAVLADGGVVRLEAGTEIVFDELARSPDSPGVTSTRLVLLAGEMQLRVPDETAASTPIEVESARARIYLIRGGSYWIGVTGADGARLIVREGTAEVLTDDGSVLVQAGEELEVSDRYGVETRVAHAGYERDIERWANDLERQAYVADYGPVEKPLHYQAASLARSGSWVRVDGRVAWRPRGVSHGWRPFTDGRWVYTPSGLTWVPVTSWGYVTSHYGSWDYRPSYGWCWFPGSVYSPAWVYWYWGPTHAAWVPYGYYARHYGPRYGHRVGFGHGYGLRFGVYGYAGGGWNAFADWTFCPLGYFGRRGGRQHYRSGRDLAYGERGVAVPRGIITTDTRGLDRAVWTRPYEVNRRLGEIHRGALAKERHRGDGELADVTSFVARRGELPANVQAMVKPRIENETRPALNRIDRPVTGGEDPRVGTRTSSRVVATKPATAAAGTPGGLSATSRSVTRSGEISGGQPSGTLFDRQPVRRPTEFERAGTTVYRSTGSDRVRLGETGNAAPSASSYRIPSSSRSPSPSTGSRLVRPEGLDRAPGRVSASPTVSPRPESSRPSVFERAPTSVYSRPSSSASPSAGRRTLPASPENRAPVRLTPEKPIYERRSLPSEGARTRTPIYTAPGRETGGESPGRSSGYVRPVAPTSSTSPVGSTQSASPPSRSQVQTVRPSPAPPRSSSSRVQSTPSRSSSSRTQASPSRSSGSRVQSSSSRVQSSSAASKASSRASSSRKRDD